jgi:hypothetical protein
LISFPQRQREGGIGNAISWFDNFAAQAKMLKHDPKKS